MQFGWKVAGVGFDGLDIAQRIDAAEMLRIGYLTAMVPMDRLDREGARRLCRGRVQEPVRWLHQRVKVPPSTGMTVPVR